MSTNSICTPPLTLLINYLTIFSKCCKTFFSHLYWNLIQTTHLMEAVRDLRDSCASAAAVVLKTATEGKKANFPHILQ